MLKKYCRKLQPPEYGAGRTNVTDDRQTTEAFAIANIPERIT